MKKVTVHRAGKNEINWVNSKYTEVDFMKSSFDNEFIVIAYVDEEKAGLGRLVKIDDTNIELGGIYVFKKFRGLGVAEKIVSELCEKNPFRNTTIWCLPFENLLNFYSRFGFKIRENGEVPDEVIKKFKWCNDEDRYAEKVLLLNR